MRIGLTYNLRSSEASSNGLTDDAEEEFDSPETIAALEDVLHRLGHEVDRLGDGKPMLHRLLEGRRPDLVFNFAEGQGIGRSREARVPAVLEMLGIPYTGSDPLTLAVTLDKDCAKRLVRAAGVATPDWVLIEDDSNNVARQLADCSFPAIVKPAYEGSSKGVFGKSLVDTEAELLETIEELLAAYRQPVLVEEFIEGDELTVGIVGNRPPEVLGAMRVIPTGSSKRFVYSLEVKRDWQRRVRYESPARLSEAETRALHEAAETCWHALGCRDLARIDFRMRGGVPYFLEVNPLPGLNPKSSDLVLIAAGVGIDYQTLIGRVVQTACERLSLQSATALS